MLINKTKIVIKGHVGTWYVIDETIIMGYKYYLLEHETFGEDAACICIDENCKVIMTNLYDGFDEVEDMLERKCLYKIGKRH